MRKLLIAFAILIFVSNSMLFSEASRISRIKIDGLKKTKESYIVKILEKFQQQDTDKLNLKDVETVLQAEGLFSEVNVEILEETHSDVETHNESESYKILHVTVKEKITLIPLPFASYSSNDGLTGGFMMMNMNAFGKKNQLIEGVMMSKKTQMGLFMFSKPAIDVKHPGFSFSGTVSHKAITLEYFNQDDYFETDALSCNANVALREKITSFLTGILGMKYSMNELWNREFLSEQYDSIADVHQWTGVAGLSLESVNWNGWYLISNNLSVEYEGGYSSDDEFVHGYKLKANLQIPVIPRLRAVFNVAGVMEFNKDKLLQSNKGDVGSSIIKNNFRSDRIAASTFSLEGALFKKKYATVSVYGSYECVAARDIDGSGEFAHGPGFGGRVYLQQIAFPAVAVGASYNVPQNKWQCVASIGVSF